MEQLLATRTALEQHFMSVGLRDAEFRRQKLVLQERGMKMERKSRVDPGGGAGGRPPRVARTVSAPQLAGLPGAPAAVGGAERTLRSPQPNQFAGICCGRLAASHPLTGHPATHPGALSPKPHQLGPPRRSQEITGGGGGSSRCASPLADHKRDSAPLFYGEAADTEWMLREGPAGAARPGSNGGCAAHLEDNPVALERFGDMMSLLGNRFKTLPRGVIWERAVFEGSTTPLQRKLIREGHIKPLGLPVRRRCLPEDVPDMDTEKGTRKSWLRMRRLQRESQATP